LPSGFPSALKDMILQGWSKEPKERPLIAQFRVSLNRMLSDSTSTTENSENMIITQRVTSKRNLKQEFYQENEILATLSETSKVAKEGQKLNRLIRTQPQSIVIGTSSVLLLLIFIFSMIEEKQTALSGKRCRVSSEEIFLWENGETYDRDMAIFNGFGICTYPKKSDKRYYQGLIKDGKKCGEGKLAFKNGETYEGNFENDNYNGFGVYTYSKESGKDYYVGHWKDAMASGEGKFVFKEGATYRGEWKNNQHDGFGVLTYSKKSKVDFYEGQWKESKKLGRGRMVWKCGTTYEGEFDNDERNGFGTYTYSEEDLRDYYEGHWKDSVKSGQGKLVWKNGGKYEGSFENDDYNGIGTFTFPKDYEFNYLEGVWNGDTKKANGKLVWKDGREEETAQLSFNSDGFDKPMAAFPL
jgi:hypothetical protein